jgi:copper chaperone
MQVFQVNDMTCGHCVGAITKAVHSVDANATVEVNLGRHEVTVDHTSANAAALSAAITEAGYTPVVVTTPTARQPQAARRSGCCGCCG